MPKYPVPTLTDVAKKAGVSTATVSRCLNTPNHVAKRTRDRVAETITALGYTPNFGARMMAMGLSPNSFGLCMAEAAYSPEGAVWVDDLVQYLDGNRKIFDAGVNAIPGLKSMNMQSTYLAWVDFEDTGMSREDFTRRVEQDARIAANHGPTFGTGGESFLRFNIGTQRANVERSFAAMQEAFSDLQ